MADNPSNIPYGYCQCGCGYRTLLAKKTSTRLGHIKDKPQRFIFGHQNRGKYNPKWNGGSTRCRGYVRIYNPSHHRANIIGYVFEHIIICEKALGKPLPVGAVTHHVNGIRDDNRSSNLVICHDNAYHRLIHKRHRAYIFCGHADWLKCPYCKQYDSPKNMKIYNDKNNTHYHLDCFNKYQRMRYIK